MFRLIKCNKSYRPVLSKNAGRLWISFGILVLLLMGYKQGIPKFEDSKTVIDTKSQDNTGIFYVGLEGDDRNPGNIFKPWGTIQRAARSVKAGDTVLIREGLYVIKNPIRPANCGKPGAWIRYAAFPGERVEIDARDIPVGLPLGTPPYPHDQGSFQIQDVCYIQVEGLMIQNARSAGFTIRDSHHVNLYHNRTNKTFSSGIAVWDTQNDRQGTDHISIIGNCITGANTQDLLPVGMRRQKEPPHEAISIAGAQHFQVAYNHIHDCFKEGIDIKETSGHGLVHHNHIHHINRQGLYVDSWFGTLEDVEIYENRIHHCRGAGIVISVENGKEVQDINIHHNIVYANSGSGLFFSKWGDGPRRHIQIHHNTFYGNGCGTPSPGSTYYWITGGLYFYSTNLEDIRVSENIFSQNCGFQIGFSNLYLKNNEDIQQVFHKKKIIIRDNVIHQTEEIKYPIRVGWPPDDFAEVYAFDGERSIIKDPLFPAPEQGNFQLMQETQMEEDYPVDF